VTKIGKGLESLRKLYATEGYVDCVAVPEVLSDESRRTNDLVIDVDEGRPYDFGRLYLEGVEPHPGAREALMNSWKTLEGKRYNPVELQRWLLANHADWKDGSDAMRIVIDSESLVVHGTLTRWPN
jgi:outer membrane protein assembly factor BamA